MHKVRAEMHPLGKFPSLFLCFQPIDQNQYRIIFLFIYLKKRASVEELKLPWIFSGNTFLSRNGDSPEAEHSLDSYHSLSRTPSRCPFPQQSAVCFCVSGHGDLSFDLSSTMGSPGLISLQHPTVYNFQVHVEAHFGLSACLLLGGLDPRLKAPKHLGSQAHQASRHEGCRRTARPAAWSPYPHHTRDLLVFLLSSSLLGQPWKCFTKEI